MHHAFKLGDAEYSLQLSRAVSGYRLHLAEGITPIDLHTDASGRDWLTVGERQVEVLIATRGDEVYVHIDGEAHALRYLHPLDRLAAHNAGASDDSIRAPMPGSLVAVSVQAGDAVAKGQTLLVMESMKMETTLTAPREGIVQAVHFDKGQTFDRDALLLSLSPAPSPASGKGK